MSAARRARIAALLLGAAPGACESLLVEPAPAVPEVAVSFARVGGGGGGGLDAFHRVDRVYLRFATGDTVKRDTVLQVAHDSTGVRARLALRTDEQVPGLGIYAELRTAEVALFKGSKIVRVDPGVPTYAEVPILPIPASVKPSRLELEIPFVGDTVRLFSAVLFASGDTIPTLAGTWMSANTLVAAVSPSGLVLGKAVGETILTVTFEELVAQVPVAVVAAR